MERICIDCKYFFRHYIENKKVYRAIDCGSCLFPKLKDKNVDDKACEYFIKKKRRKKQNEETMHGL